MKFEFWMLIFINNVLSEIFIKNAFLTNPKIKLNLPLEILKNMNLKHLANFKPRNDEIVYGYLTIEELL